MVVLVPTKWYAVGMRKQRATGENEMKHSNVKQCKLLRLFLAGCLLASILCNAQAFAETEATNAPDMPLEKSTIVQLKLDSAFTGISMPVRVYLPKGYGGTERYPVWYGLNSYSTTENMWLGDAGIGDVADLLIAQGKLRPLVMVFPLTKYDSAKAVQEDMLDGVRGPSQMEAFVCSELVPYIDSHFYVLTTPQERYMGGFSMGGLFALQIGMHHPELFSKVGAYSPALIYNDFSGNHLDTWLANGNATPKTAVQTFAEKHGLKGLQIFLDCGSDGDPFFDGVTSLHQELLLRGLDVSLDVHAGGHSLQSKRLADYLLFYAAVH